MPRGSNNRLNEASKARRNANRLFDSQNNNNGGYNVADKYDTAAEVMSEQHQEMYFQSGTIGKSFLTIEWFNQHGCGKKDDKDTNAIDCHMVLQYKCDDQLRNGISLDRPEYTKPKKDFESFEEKQARFAADEKVNNAEGKQRGVHETWENYDSCRVRHRNFNLFTADQKVGSHAIHTRQNPQGTRRGYECSEERDYFPYWHPTEWTDIAVLTSNVDSCHLYQTETSNRKAKGECIERMQNADEEVIVKHASVHNNPKSCENSGGEWLDFFNFLSVIEESEEKCGELAKENGDIVWGYPRRIGEKRHEYPAKKCLLLHPKIDCSDAPWSRANHLGNSDTSDFAQYRWELPRFLDENPKQCVFRMRYNISSDDYPEHFDSGDIRPYFAHKYLKNDPKVTINGGVELQLAINTAQIARTFQDRSHTFILMPRSKGNIGDFETIENIQVRGKRGNIVQTFPAVEYDFSPQRSQIAANSLVHVQWAGSNSNPNGNDGEGTKGSDRNNMVTIDNVNWNIPQGDVEIDDKIKTIVLSGVSYKILQSEFRTFHGAHHFCEERGMRLPVPKSDDETRIMAETIGNGGNFFLGISDEDSEGAFVDIYNGKPLSYTNWNRREPNDFTRENHHLFGNGEDYVVFLSRNGGKWNDAPPHWRNGRAGSVQTVCIGKTDDLSEPVTLPSMFEKVEWIWTSAAEKSVMVDNKNLEIQMATAGYYDCVEDCEKSPENLELEKLQAQLNNAPASFTGNVFRLKNSGTQHFISTRNNNFSNRAQKGDITVKMSKLTADEVEEIEEVVKIEEIEETEAVEGIKELEEIAVLSDAIENADKIKTFTPRPFTENNKKIVANRFQ